MHNCPLCEASVPTSLQFQYRDPKDLDKVIIVTLGPKTIAALQAIGVDPYKCTFSLVKEPKNVP